MARVELPDGNWAELKEPDELTGEDEVKVKSAVSLGVAERDDGADRDGDDDRKRRVQATSAGPAQMEYAMLARVITSWSLPQPINAANIRALKLSFLRPLKKAIEPHMQELRDDPNSPAGQ